MLTTYFANAVMGNVFNSDTSKALPATYYLALSSTAPSADGKGITEPSGYAYTRMPLTMTVPTDGAVYNQNSVGFPTATGNWGVMTHFVVFDAATGGNALLYNTLKKSRTVEEDTTLTFDANALMIQLNLDNVEA